MQETECLEKSKRSYDGIDLFKLVAAMLVVWLHATETTDVVAVGIQFAFTRWCVPFFFICSGFFFQKGINNASDPKAYFLAYEKRLLRIFLFWGVCVTGPFVVIDYIRNNPKASILRLMLLLIRRMFVIGYGAYWYLVALIISTIFLYMCYKTKQNRMLITLIIGGVVFLLGYSSFQGFVGTIPAWLTLNKLFYFAFSSENNFIMQGIPFCGIGWLISKYAVSVKKSYALAGTALFTMLRAVEFLVPRVFTSSFLQENSFSIFFIPQAVMFFFLACHCAGFPKQAKNMRQLSTFIYLTHWTILYHILDPVLLHGLGVNIYEPLLIPIKVLLTIVICMGLNLLLKKTKNKSILILIGG